MIQIPIPLINMAAECYLRISEHVRQKNAIYKSCAEYGDHV